MQLDEHHVAYGAEMQKQADKFFQKVLLFSLVLVLSHLLNVPPSEVDALGMKISVPDSSIIHGVISLLLLHFFYLSISSSLVGGALLRLNTNKPVMRGMLKSSRKAKPKVEIRRIKRSAKRKFTIYLIFIMPYVFSVLFLGMIGVALALFDVYEFVGYLLERAIS